MFYTHGALDRADHVRKDPEAVRALRARPDARLLPVWKGAVLVSRWSPDAGADGAPAATAPGRSMPRPPPGVVAATLPGDAALDGVDEAVGEIFLGLVGDVPLFAVSVSVRDDAPPADVAALATGADGAPLDAEFSDLRVVGPVLGADDGALLAYARGLVWWAETTRFCSRCGRELVPTNGGHVRRCTKEERPHTHFPRTDPAVIMLVTHDAGDGAPERCLLGRAPAWPPGVFSTLAGFVEPGESLEQAVSREVLEEAGIETSDVAYVASQPWPFPRSIMLGFTARATGTDVRVDETELADARWFAREEIRTFGDWGDGGEGLKLPRTDSIARFLIERWLDEAVDRTI